MRWGWGDKYNKPKKEQIFPQTISGISSHFVLADPWWLGTQSLFKIYTSGLARTSCSLIHGGELHKAFPKSIALRLICFSHSRHLTQASL
jgi:hypothetical protein